MQFRPLLTAIAATVVATAAVMPAQAALFNVSFDGTPNSTVASPIVGTGTFSFTGNAISGTTVALSSLSNLAFSFTFGGVTFDEGDLATPLANIQVSFTTVGTDVLANFGGTSGGPFNGSMDFVAGSDSLSFQPGFGSLYFTRSNFGTYQAVLAPTVSVPEPGSMLLAGLALAALATARRRA